MKFQTAVSAILFLATTTPSGAFVGQHKSFGATRRGRTHAYVVVVKGELSLVLCHVHLRRHNHRLISIILKITMLCIHYLQPQQPHLVVNRQPCP
jgi:hypothetical protein